MFIEVLVYFAGCLVTYIVIVLDLILSESGKEIVRKSEYRDSQGEVILLVLGGSLLFPFFWVVVITYFLIFFRKS